MQCQHAEAHRGCWRGALQHCEVPGRQVNAAYQPVDLGPDDLHKDFKAQH